MEIKRRERDGVLVLGLEGKLHHGTGDVRFREAVERALAEGHRKVLLDLKGVSSMDSSGLGELVRSKVTAAQAGAEVKLVNLDMKVYELLTISALVPAFEIFEDEAEALASFG
jgi:anti-sigma B factor antagonist